jgi:hypothetical protein
MRNRHIEIQMFMSSFFIRFYLEKKNIFEKSQIESIKKRSIMVEVNQIAVSIAAATVILLVYFVYSIFLSKSSKTEENNEKIDEKNAAKQKQSVG